MSERRTILADRIFDGTRLRDGLFRIELEGDAIVELRSVSPDEAVPRLFLDARGHTVLPGMINAHAHAIRGGGFAPVEPISVPQMIRNLRSMLAAGVTTVGDMGSPAALITTMREHVRRHPTAGPSIFGAGPIVTAPGGYPLDWLPPLYVRLGVAVPCGTDTDARRAVGRLARQGVDHVKIAIMHESYGGGAIPALRQPVAKAVVAEAHTLGLRVLAHAHTTADYLVALAAGVDALMHSSFEPIDARLLAQIRDSGVAVCPTLFLFDSVCAGAEARWDHDTERTRFVSRGIRRDWSQFCDAYAASGDVLPPGIAGGRSKASIREFVKVASANLMLLRDAGVPVAFGTDAAYGFCVLGKPIDELNAMKRAGLSNLECLRALTSGAASILGRSDRGRLEAGKRADLIVVDGNPETDLAALDKIRAVVVAGRRLEHPWPASDPGSALGTGAAAVLGLARTAARALRNAP